MSASDTPTTTPTPATAATHRRPALATLALLATTAIWGSSFPLSKDLVERVPTLDLLAVRFAIAGLFMLAVAHRSVLRLPAASRNRAFALGGVYAVAQILQTAGLAHTSASVSGFVTGLYVVATPLLAALILSTRITPITWVGVALATTGMAVLTLDGFSIGSGEAITLLGAVFYALHIVGLGAWSRPGEAMGMSVVQLLTISVICFVGTAPGGVVLPATGIDWLSMVYMALFGGALALLAQTWAQAQLPPTRSAIIMSMEPVFAASFAVGLTSEELSPRLLLGGGVVLAAMLVVELAPRRRQRAAAPPGPGDDPPNPGAVQHLTI